MIALLLAVAATPVDSAPPHLAAAVRADLAAQWHVDPATMRLEWGSFGTPDSMVDHATFRLEGGSKQGWFAVIITPPHSAMRAVRVHVGVLHATSVATHAMPVGYHLTASDIGTGEAVAWGPPDSSRAPSLIGWEVRSAVAAGDALTPPDVAPPLVIGFGDSVTVRWVGQGIAVERGAVAAQSARLGDVVRVRVGRVQITARATGAGEAEVGGGVR